MIGSPDNPNNAPIVRCTTCDADYTDDYPHGIIDGVCKLCREAPPASQTIWTHRETGARVFVVCVNDSPVGLLVLHHPVGLGVSYDIAQDTKTAQRWLIDARHDTAKYGHAMPVPPQVASDPPDGSGLMRATAAALWSARYQYVQAPPPVNLDQQAPCPTCLVGIGAQCVDGGVSMGNGVHTARFKLAKVMPLIAKVKHLL